MSGSNSRVFDLWEAIENEDFSTANVLIQDYWSQTTDLIQDGIGIIHLLSGLDKPEARNLLEECLYHGASPNVPSDDGITPVHLAAMWGLYDNLALLVQHGGDPDIMDVEGHNALYYAYQSTEPRAGLCVQYLRSARDLIEKEASSYSLYSKKDGFGNQTSEGFTKIKGKPSTRKINQSPKLTRYVFNPDELMTEDESSLDGQEQSTLSVLGNTSESFYTAHCDLSMTRLNETLDDTVVSFPKLHPWMSKSRPQDLDDTVVENFSYLKLESSIPDADSHNKSSILMPLNSTLADGTILYNWKDYSILELSHDSDVETTLIIPEDLKSLGSQEIREELTKLGYDVGPIRADTRMLYLRRLAKIKDEVVATEPQCLGQCQFNEFIPEMRAVLWQRITTPIMHEEEKSMCIEFSKKGTWREGTEKSSFNYLLLDPRVTQNLPLRAKDIPEEEAFKIFVSAIFYVGKGKRSRPYAHLHEALHKSKTNRKLSHIREIWSSGHGVVSLHCYQSVIPVEAYTREACMVEALGLTRLTNQKRGEYYGRARSWGIKKKRQMGIFLLKRALQIFLNEGEREICQEDLRK